MPSATGLHCGCLMALVVSVLVVLIPWSQAAAATFLVDSTADEVDMNPGDGACQTISGTCTLRAAIQEANALGSVPGGHVIVLPAGTYLLSLAGAGEDAAATGDLDIRTHLTITGAGANVTVVDGGALDTVFDILPEVTVEISRMTIRNGHGAGFPGGIDNDGELLLNDCIITANTAASGNAGGAWNSGSMTLNNCLVTDNVAELNGGGLYNRFGALTLINSTVSGNATRRFDGGGIANNLGTVALLNSTVNGNTAADAGGGIWNDSSLTITNSTISDNMAGGRGGGVFNDDGTLTLVGSTVSGNAGGFANSGGGLYNHQFGTLTLTNSTVSGNTTGGIFNDGIAMLTLTNSTISDNTGFGIHNSSANGSVELQNTIIADTTAGANCSGLIAAIISNGHNLDSGNTCGLVGPGDLSATDPRLGPLQDNGGPTETHALLAGSPAIDAGDNAACPADDQRGVVRPQGGVCDIGAYEDIAITIDARGLTGNTFGIAGINNAIPKTVPITPATPQGLPVVHLLPGSYFLMAAGGSVFFTVTATGVTYDPGLEGTLAGRGTATLTVVFGSAGMFNSSQQFAAEHAFLDVKLGDFNRDGRLDVAAVGARAGANVVAILLGAGDGSVGSPTTIALPGGLSPVGMAVGDVDRDGDLDLAVANRSANSVSILLGDGSGGFVEVLPRTAVGAEPNGVAFGDFDGDGILDMTVANRGFNTASDSLAVLRGNGAGGFQHFVGSPITVGTRPVFVLVHDLNRDGNRDIVVANAGGSNVPGTGTLSILLGHGDGRFEPPTEMAIEGLSTPVWLDSGDLNRDGMPDLVVVDIDFPDTVLDKAAVLLGNGDGTFRPPINLNVEQISDGRDARAGVIGDFNRDGALDVWVTVESSRSQFFLGNGDGTFAHCADVTRTGCIVNSLNDKGIPAAVLPGSVRGTALGDLNGDGRLDVVVAGTRPESGRGGVYILLNASPGIDSDGDGLTDAEEAALGTNPSLADSDGDGLSDSEEVALGTDPTRADSDGDTVPDEVDNCPLAANPDQADLNGDGAGDACQDLDDDGMLDSSDPCPLDPTNNADGDAVCACLVDKAICDRVQSLHPESPFDNCPFDRNPPTENWTDRNGVEHTNTQPDVDLNGVGDACDSLKGTARAPSAEPSVCSDCLAVLVDTDGDGLPDTLDAHPENPDSDGDAVLDGEDNCVTVPNPRVAQWTDIHGIVHLNAQPDVDLDGSGDACDCDLDGDGLANPQVLDANALAHCALAPGTPVDNCPFVPNPTQANQDGDALGDACDDDRDGDGLLNTDEVRLGTSPTNPDTDGDLISDGPSDPDGVGPIVAGPDPFPLGPLPPFSLVLQVWDANNTDITADYLPTAEFLPGNPNRNPVRLVAQLKDTATNTVVALPQAVTFTLTPSRLPGVATNDPAIDTSNDFSFDRTNKNVLTRTITTVDATSAEVLLYAFDYGGNVRITVTTTAPNGQPVSVMLTQPKDSDGDDLPDAWENLYRTAGFDPFNAHSFSPVLSDSEADVDTSLDNPFVGDGLPNRREYRGILFGPLTQRPATCPTIPGEPHPSGHVRLDPTRKDLFVRGDNFCNSLTPRGKPVKTPPDVLPFSVHVPGGNAFAEAGIAVHDVTGLARFKGPAEPPFVDILVVTNVITCKTPSSDDKTKCTLQGATDGFTNHRISLNTPRDWTWDTKGASYVGTADNYAFFTDPGTGVVKRGVFVYHQNLAHYFFNRPYVGVSKQADWKTHKYGAQPYQAGYEASVFDANGNGLVENPPVEAGGEREYTQLEVQTHTVIHEMGHGIGIVGHTSDPLDVMHNASQNWHRAGHFSPAARGQILIHNR